MLDPIIKTGSSVLRNHATWAYCGRGGVPGVALARCAAASLALLIRWPAGRLVAVDGRVHYVAIGGLVRRTTITPTTRSADRPRGGPVDHRRRRSQLTTASSRK
jgi:hypothetical protein